MTARILVLDTAEQTHNSYIPLAVVDALRRHPDVAIVHLAGYGDAVDLFRREGCDTFLALGGTGCDLAVVNRLCALAKRSAIWLTEDPYELQENLRISAAFDAVFTNDLASLPVYGRNARHLPLAASLLFHNHTPVGDEADYFYDLCFVGTAWPNRVATIDRVLARAGRPLHAKIALPTNAHLPPVVLSDQTLSTDWRVANPELARIANRSRITLNLERKFSASRADQAGGSTPPPRLFETALAGSFQISLGVSAEAKRYFDPRTEVVFCATEDELIGQIAWALDNPEARVAMAQAARQRALDEHLYDHRVDAILRALDERTTEKAATSAINIATVSSPLQAQRRKRILFVTHNVAGVQRGGGIEVYQAKLVEAMGAFDLYTLYPQAANGTLIFTLITHRTGRQHRYGAPDAGRGDTLHDAAQERVFERILIENEIDLVHFQHLLGMPLSLPLIARACGVPTLYTLHDFYLVCMRFNLLDHRGRFCDIARRSPTECDICLGAAGIPAGSQQRRRNFVGRVLEAIDVVVANSPYTADYLRAIYPNLRAERVRIVEMLTPTGFHPPRPAPSVDADQSDPPLRVAVPGNFTNAKGADTVVRAFCALKDEPVDFFIIGLVQDPALYQHLRDLALPRVTIHGGYEAAELPRLMENMDVSLHLSLWPETYMISLNEARCAGAVPIVTILGAPAERVSDGVDGFLVQPEDAGRVCDLIRELCHDRERLSAMRRAGAARRPVPPAEHVTALTRVYDEVIARSPAPSRPLAFNPQRDFVLSARACGVRTNTPFWTQEGHGWDEAPRSSPNAGRTSHAFDMWRTFPAQFTHLPHEEAPQGALNVERFEGDLRGEEHLCRSADRRAAAGHTLGVRGWAFVYGRGRPLDVIIQLQGIPRGGFEEVYAVGRPMSRKDVSEHLDVADAEMSGFEVDLDVSELPDGPYTVRLLQVYDGLVVSFGILGEAIVSSKVGAQPASLSGPTVPAAGGKALDPGQGSQVRRAAGGAGITRFEALPKEAGKPGYVLEGWAVDRDSHRVLPEVRVGFHRPGSAPAWFQAERVRAPTALADGDPLFEDPLFTFAGFQLALPPGAVGPGLYRMSVAELDRAEGVLHDTDEVFMLLADRVLTASPLFDVGPGAVARVMNAPPDHHMHLDRAKIEREPGRGADERAHLYLRGWVFVPSLGRANQLALQLVGERRTLRVPLAAVPRWDVAEHHGEAAAWSGFEALVPLTAIPPGRYRAEFNYATAQASAALPLDLGLNLAIPLAA